MREISQSEVQQVSGAGLTEVISGLTTAMENVSATLETTVASISTATDSWTIRGLTHKAISLSRTYAKLSFLSSLLSSFNTTTTESSTTA